MEISVSTRPEFENIVSSHHLVVVDFMASWCRSCKSLLPKFKELSKELNEVVRAVYLQEHSQFLFLILFLIHTRQTFLKIDVDEMQELADEFAVTSLPFFVCLRDGKKIDSYAGSVWEKVCACAFKEV